MSCLITLETRPCEDPINFEVLLLPVKLTIAENTRWFAVRRYKSLIVGTPEQGNDFAINLLQDIKETSAFLPSRFPSEKTPRKEEIFS